MSVLRRAGSEGLGHAKFLLFLSRSQDQLDARLLHSLLVVFFARSAENHA